MTSHENQKFTADKARLHCVCLSHREYLICVKFVKIPNFKGKVIVIIMLCSLEMNAVSANQSARSMETLFKML